jgi:signal transduction histidine kinase/CheY-like chemotaxis protein
MQKVLDALESGEPFGLLCDAIVESVCQLRQVQGAVLELAPDARQSAMTEVARFVSSHTANLASPGLNQSTYPIKRFGVIVGRLIIWATGILGKGVQQRIQLHALWGGIAFERARAGTQIQTLLERLQVLNDLIQLVSSNASLHNLSSEVARQAASRFHAKVGVICTAQRLDETTSFTVMGGFGCPPSVIHQTISAKEGVLSEIVKSLSQLGIQSLPDNPDPAMAWMEKWGMRSVHIGPLLLNNQLFGVCILGFPRERTLTRPDEERLEEFLVAAAVGLANARNRDSLVAYSEQLESLIETRTKQLENESARAREASQAKSRFLANMSHELHNPLTSIIGFSSLLSEGMYGEMTAEQSDALAGITKSSIHLKNLIADILDLTRIESGEESAIPETVDVNQLLAQVVRLMHQSATEKQLAFSCEEQHDQLYAFGDPRHLRQILINLVSNAIKYTKPGGMISIGASTVDNRVRISVKDSGIGMSSKLLKTLFDRFSRGDDEYTRQQEGSGIGLAIVHQLLSLNKGMIEVESTTNLGSTFIISFPIALPPPFEMQEADVYATPLSLAGHTILVLDDDPSTRRIIHAVLKTCGAEIILCDSIGEAEANLVAAEIDLIISDINLYSESNLPFIEKIRQDCEKIPIILVSGSAFQEDKAKAYAAGTSDFVSKPFETRALVESVRRALSEPKG